MTVLVVTGTGTGVGKTIATAALASAARQVGIDVAVCKPVQTGTAAGDDDLADVTRLTGLAKVVGLARYPQPLAPLAAAEQAGRSLPTRRTVLKLIRAIDHPGQLTLVEGAGGLLVELASGGVTLRDLAADLGAAVLVVATAELGTLNHTALTVESLAAQQLSCAGLVIGNWPSQPGWWRPPTGRRWPGWLRSPPAACGAARRGGIDEHRRVHRDERARVRPSLAGRAGRLMVHSIELLFDPDTEAAVRAIWGDLAAADIPSRVPTGRPHVTLAVAERIAPDVDPLLHSVKRQLPLACTVGAPLLFGRANAVLARLIVPSAELLALHAEVHRLCGPYLLPGPLPNSLPGQWTAHVTVARRVGDLTSKARSGWRVTRRRFTAQWPVCGAGTAPNASNTRSAELLAAAARAGAASRRIGRRTGSGKAAAGDDQVFVSNRLVGQEVLEYLSGSCGVTGLR